MATAKAVAVRARFSLAIRETLKAHFVHFVQFVQWCRLGIPHGSGKGAKWPAIRDR